MDFLNDMALFVEVVKAKGFRGAAEALHMPNSTISRRISVLEKAIGLRLLHRTTRKVELTEAGQVYYERCKRIVDEARLAHEQLGAMLAQPTGTLRASLPVDFAVIYMAPLIAEFAQLYPGITFDFDLTPRQINLVTEPFDVAIRIGEQEDSRLVARHLASMATFLYASPAYLARQGAPAMPAELEHHQCFTMNKAGKWTLYSGDQVAQVAASCRYMLNSMGLLRRLATLDQGIILTHPAIVADDLAAGRLRQVLPDWHGKPVPVYAVTETRLLPAKTQRFIEFLKQRLEGGASDGAAATPPG